MPNKSGIYCIENIINHKRYIGQAKDFNKRIYHHTEETKKKQSEARKRYWDAKKNIS